MTQFRSMSKGGTVAPRVQSAFGGPPFFFWRGLFLGYMLVYSEPAHSTPSPATSP
ncbi:hypothetical protein CROQUDRAFT_667181, partial [Cronartium quercuum f. sp. fusiforme G11]